MFLKDLARPLIDSAINTAIQKVVDQGFVLINSSVKEYVKMYFFRSKLSKYNGPSPQRNNKSFDLRLKDLVSLSIVSHIAIIK